MNHDKVSTISEINNLQQQVIALQDEVTVLNRALELSCIRHELDNSLESTKHWELRKQFLDAALLELSKGVIK